MVIRMYEIFVVENGNELYLTTVKTILEIEKIMEKFSNVKVYKVII
jgi:hypothetical protein